MEIWYFQLCFPYDDFNLCFLWCQENHKSWRFFKTKGTSWLSPGPRRTPPQRDSRGGPGVTILPFQCRGRRFDLLVGELRPHVPWGMVKKEKKRKEKTLQEWSCSTQFWIKVPGCQTRWQHQTLFFFLPVWLLLYKTHRQACQRTLKLQWLSGSVLFFQLLEKKKKVHQNHCLVGA